MVQSIQLMDLLNGELPVGIHQQPLFLNHKQEPILHFLPTASMDPLPTRLQILNILV